MSNDTNKVKDPKRLTEKLLSLIVKRLQETNEAFEFARDRYNISFHLMEIHDMQKGNSVFYGKSDIRVNFNARNIHSVKVYINLSPRSFDSQILTIFHELAEIEVAEMLLKRYRTLTERDIQMLQKASYTDWLTFDKDQKYAVYHGAKFVEAQKCMREDTEGYYLKGIIRHEEEIREIFNRIGALPRDLERLFGKTQVIKGADEKQFDFGDCEIEEIMSGFDAEDQKGFKQQCLSFAESLRRATEQEFRKIKITMVEEKKASLEIFGNKSREGLEKIALPGRFLYSPEILSNVQSLAKNGFNVIDLSDPSKYYSRFFTNKILTEEKALMFLNNAILFNDSRDFSKTRRSLFTLRTIPNSKVPEGRVEIYEPTLMVEDESGQKEAAIFHGGWVAPGIKGDNAENYVLKELLKVYETGEFMDFSDKVRTLNEDDISNVLKGMKSKNTKFREVTIDVLRILDEPKYLEIILGAFEDPVPEIQYKAAGYLSKKRPSLILAPFLMGEILTTLFPFDEKEMQKGLFCLEALDQIDSKVLIPEEWIMILTAVEDEDARSNFGKIVKRIDEDEGEEQELDNEMFRNRYMPEAGMQVTIRDIIANHCDRKGGYSTEIYGRLNIGVRDQKKVVSNVLGEFKPHGKLIKDNTKNSYSDTEIYEAIGCSLEEIRKKDWREITKILEERYREKTSEVKNMIARICRRLLFEKATGLIKKANEKGSDISRFSAGEMEALVDDLKEEADSVERNMNTGRCMLTKSLMKQYSPKVRKQVLEEMLGPEMADKVIKEFEKAEKLKQMADLISILLTRVKSFKGSFELPNSENLKKLIQQTNGNSLLPSGCPAEALRVIFREFIFNEFSKESLYELRRAYRPSTVDMEVRMLKKIGILLPVKGKPKHYRINPAIGGSTHEETEKNLEAVYNIKLKTSPRGKECPLDGYSIPEDKIPAVKERVKLEILHRHFETAVKAKQEDKYIIKMWSGYAVSREQKAILQKIRARLSDNGYKIDFGNITDEKKSVKELVDFAISPDGNKDNTVIVLPFKEQYVQENLSNLKNAHVIFIDYDRRKVSHERFFHIGGIIAAGVAYLANNDFAFNNICNILTNNTGNIDVTIEQLKKDPTLLTLLLDPILIKNPDDLKSLNERMTKLLMSV